MAYTIERLQRVKELICSKRTVSISSHDSCKYSLRRRRTQTAALLSTWIDDDEDDDTYEPEPRVCSKRKRPRQSDLAKTRYTKRNRSDRLIITMALTSEAGKAFLASLPIHQDESLGQEDEMWKAAEEMMAVLDPDETAPKPAIKDPNAQPCAMCMTFELDCLLTKDPYAYPCHVCAEMGIKCELLVRPQWKKTCENCKTARRTCSYDTDDTGHDLPCTACRASREDCVAGPARHRPVLRPATPMRETISSSSKAPPGVDSSSKEEGNRAPTRTIRTALAHPVNFSYVPPDDGSNPCHWCDDFAFGLVGLGTRQAEVLDSGDGRLIEVKGGHVIEGHEPSRMCVTCALERIHIMQCPGHRMGSLKGYDPATFDFDAAYASLVEDPGEAATRRLANPWCSLCIAPAFYGCRAIQKVNAFQEAVDPQSPEAIGCGLLLCEKCDMLLRVNRGDVRRVVRMNETAGGETEGRADVEYLLPGNAMWRAYVS